jgi:hypothetical protein
VSRPRVEPAQRHLPIAVRAHVPPIKERRPRRLTEGPDLVLVFDTETSVDAAQRLLFGSYRVYREGRLIEEGLFHGEDNVREVLEAYARAHSDDRGGHLRVLSRAEFVERLVWRIGYVARARIVGFNLPFDLSRVAVGVRPGPARNGGFTLLLFESVDASGQRRRHLWRPEIVIKADGSKRQFIHFTTPARLDADLRVDGRAYRGRYLDLRTFAYALTDRGFSLDRAAAEFGLSEQKGHALHAGLVTPEYIDYNRQDVRTTWALYQALMDEWSRHPIDLAPEQAFSPAAISKAYLRAAGIGAPLDR